MATGKRKRTALPRLTILAYSRQELQRHSDRMEGLSAAVLALTDLVERLQAQVDRLERRSGAARKANATRKAPAAVQPPEGNAPDFIPVNHVGDDISPDSSY